MPAWRPLCVPPSVTVLPCVPAAAPLRFLTHRVFFATHSHHHQRVPGHVLVGRRSCLARRLLALRRITAAPSLAVPSLAALSLAALSLAALALTVHARTHVAHALSARVPAVWAHWQAARAPGARALAARVPAARTLTVRARLLALGRSGPSCSHCSSRQHHAVATLGGPGLTCSTGSERCRSGCRRSKSDRAEPRARASLSRLAERLLVAVWWSGRLVARRLFFS